MLDGCTSALLRAIADGCAPGTYRIFSGEDFLALFSEPPEEGEQFVEKALFRLSEEGYIGVKYAGGGMDCVCPLPPAGAALERAEGEEQSEGEPEETEKTEGAAREAARADRRAFLAAFWGGFAGALAGGLIAAAILLSIRLIFG